jgi:Sec-independent protein translocase protein TatA
VFLLSPEKILVVLVVAVIVLGPEKLPEAARRVSSSWHMVRKLQARAEAEARAMFPELPDLNTLGQAARSPLAYLDRLASESEAPPTPASAESDPEGTAGSSFRSAIGGDRYRAAYGAEDPSCN